MSFKIILNEIEKNLEYLLNELKFPQTKFNVESAKPSFGDITSNISFLLAKNLKKTPKETSQLLAEKYQKFLGGVIDRVESHPSGYLNFFVNVGKFNEKILKNSIDEQYGTVNLGDKKKIIVEHTSVNPNKALHIGHVRNVVIGDSIARILTQANFQVSVLNYVDDSGLQVADIILGFKHLGFSIEPPKNQKFDHYCGDEVYVKTTEEYEKNPSLADTRKEILKQIEDSCSEIAKFADSITKKVLACQLQTCWELGATYDCLNFESQIIRSGLWSKTFEKLKNQKLIKFVEEGKNSGCWVIPGSDNEDDKVLVRSNGTATYIAKDIPYASWKLGLLDDPFNYKKYDLAQPGGKTLWETTLEETSEEKLNLSADRVITVIDSRQSRLQKIITKLMSNFKSKPDVYIHLGYESVVLSSDTAKFLGIDTQGKQAQMSGRKGLYVNADSVLDLLKEKTKSETRKRNPELNDEQLTRIAKDVAVGAIRYEMIKQDLDRIITFDLSSSLSLEGDTAPYIQYTFARASRILEKSEREPNFDGRFDLLKTGFELNLVKLIGQFDSAVEDAAKNYAPKVMAKYCHELAVSFNAFYEHVKVLESGYDELTNSRLCLVLSFKKVLENALHLIGINAPYRM